MDVLFFAKYPPIVGGLSSSVYWKTWLLGLAGIRVTVVTNATQALNRHRLIWKNETELQNVKVRYLSNKKSELTIPRSEAYVPRLTSIACEIMENQSVDLIEANYLEPNAIPAFLISQWFNVPYGIKHAGSDIGRLLCNSEYVHAYKRILQRADYVLTGLCHFDKLLSMNVKRNQLIKDYFVYPVREYFNPYGDKLDLNEYARLVQSITNNQLMELSYYQRLARNRFDTSRPTIGIYGKASSYKGHFELIKALSSLKTKGYEFNLAIITQGAKDFVSTLYEHLQKNNLSQNTLLLPFIPNQDIPRYIRSCDAICYLENNFPIKHHNTSKVPMEVLFCGRHLIISSDVANHHNLKSIPSFHKSATIVSMEEALGLYHGLKSYLDNLEHYQKKAIELYENNCLFPQMCTDKQVKNIANFYVRLLKATNKNHNKLKIKDIH